MTERATFWENRRIEDTKYLLRVLRANSWDVQASAKEAGMNRSSFYKYIERLSIKTPVTNWRDAHRAIGTEWRHDDSF